MTSEIASTGSGSRIPNFFKLSVGARIEALRDRTALTEEDLAALDTGTHTLKLHLADKMIENVVGVFGLPMGVALNFLIDSREVIVPLSVEEPSIVAGLSGAARTARLSGGYVTDVTDPLLIGQVQVVNVADVPLARQTLLQRKEEVLNLANSLHPKMVARGGGARDVEVFHHRAPEGGNPEGPERDMLVMHLLVDTRDAMGANIVNGMCEGVASLVEAITGGRVFLRILSNLTDRSLVRARVRIPVQNLAMKDYAGTAVRDGIILANDLALVDPYRAATHNKGIMNGVDAVAIATGNDFRAIEAAAHAYAAKSGRYRALTRWYANDDGDLEGEIEMPMKVGTVGGSLGTNPTVRLSHRLLNNPNAAELAAVIGAVGLAQNYAALRSLATAGIQQNHMTLHARSVASTAGVPEEYFDEVVEGLIESGEIKVWKAEEIVRRLTQKSETAPATDAEPRSSACGKVILLGEHAVVYGRSALAAPIPLAVEARVVDAGDGVQLVIPRWGVEQRVAPVREHPTGAAGILALLLERLDLGDRSMTIEVFPNVPRAVGLGGSAALAVSVIRALDRHFALNLSDPEINDFALECERAAHGTPSGVDNTVATFGKAVLFRAASNGRDASFAGIELKRPLPLVIGMTGKESLTAKTVAGVAQARRRNAPRYDAIFDQIEMLTNAGADAARDGALSDLGELMNLCHGFLNALQISTRELEELVEISRRHGAAGAKLTGGGGGGSIVAVCPDGTDSVLAGIKNAGYDALAFEVS
ncbi:MAG: hydroxymethylglutaryl-CoA reductase, degradative [Gammaproteobacteria bacterium]|nr:hydroxymethylglutaryl-CoA reductase, degradative [Gammaproteobacteria bacterium]